MDRIRVSSTLVAQLRFPCADLGLREMAVKPSTSGYHVNEFSSGESSVLQ